MGHDGSVTILEGDQIVVHHQLERFNGLKNQFYPTVNLFDKIKRSPVEHKASPTK